MDYSRDYRDTVRASWAASLVGLIVAGLLSACSHAAPARTQWLLSYDGSYERSSNEPDFYERLLNGPPAETCPRPLVDGVIFLGIRAAGSGHWFAAWMDDSPANWASGDDWLGYLDSLTSAHGVLRRLDNAAKSPIGVAVMLPALSRSASTISLAHRRVPVRAVHDAAAFYAVYLDSMQLKASRLSLAHVRLNAVYWLDEAAWGDDSARVAAVAKEVHARSLDFLWIPYYDAPSATRWRALGFDVSWQQPNYFFDARIPLDRLERARERADSASMGFELEFDSRIFADVAKRQRLDQYLDLMEARSLRSLAIYDGGGALYRLFADSTNVLAALRHRVARALCDRH